MILSWINIDANIFVTSGKKLCTFKLLKNLYAFLQSLIRTFEVFSVKILVV
jgi:hypothetical protein